MLITLTELNYVVAVAKEMHFSKAAQTCFVSQPTLSIAIKKLEDRLGVAIFERDKNKVLITVTGQEIIVKAQQIIENVSNLQNFAKEQKNIYEQPLKLGAINTVGPYLLPQLITSLQQNNSKIKLTIEEDFTSNLARKLNDGNLDAIIVAQPFTGTNLEFQALYSEPFDIITPNDHPLTKLKTNINPSELTKQTLLILDKGNCFRDQVLQICPQCDLNNTNQSTTMIITSSIETIKYMVASNIGISIVPRYSMHDKDKASIKIKHFIKPEPQRDIVIMYRSSFSRKAIINEITTLIQKIHRNV
jgi:LysR family transcriptional regulator, hydrogen peroxide-inducible genes activator